MKSAARTTKAPDLAEAVRQRIGPDSYELWFARHARLRLEADALIVGVATLYLQEWLQKKFLKPLREVAQTLSGRALAVKFTIEPALFLAARQEQEAVKGGERGAGSGERAKTPEPIVPTPLPMPSTPRSRKSEPQTLFDPAPRPATTTSRTATKRRWHHLNEFVVGPCNRVAFASAQSVVEAVHDSPNPLVLHGPVGTGKTHLLEGIFAGLRQHEPDLVVRYVTAEEFTNRFVASVYGQKASQFRKQFRECDVLLLDDLHFIATKKATQEEFLHTFDALQSDGRSMVLTCDCHPSLADDFLPELADRLKGGAVCGLQPPDAATRLELLRAKCARADSLIDDAVLQFLASQLRGNVRELEGALVNVRHYARVHTARIDIPLVRAALGDLLRHAVRVVKLVDVDAAVCQVLRLAHGTLQSKGRAWSVSHPRMLAIFLARKLTSASYSEIGQHFGGRNHSTAVAAEKRVRVWIQQNSLLPGTDRPAKVRDAVEQVERLLGV